MGSSWRLSIPASMSGVTADLAVTGSLHLRLLVFRHESFAIRVEGIEDLKHIRSGEKITGLLSIDSDISERREHSVLRNQALPPLCRLRIKGRS